MKIAQLDIENPFILAPLAGITNLPFRQMIKSCGCGLVCSEMVSANGLVYGSSKTMDYLISDVNEKPVSFQIFGSHPEIMADAAQIVESKGADIVDINLGCSVRKVLKTGSGAALMGDYQKAETIFQAVRQAVRIPVTIKIRSGWDASGADAIEISLIAQSCGIDAIAIHPRTARQAFGGKADWRIIRKLKKMLTIPVIGNGDVDTPDKAFQMISETGCDAVMIGRAAVYNPWLFKQIIARYHQDPQPDISLVDRFNDISVYIDRSIATMGEIRACRLMRSRLGWFTKGLPNSSRFRDGITKVENREQVQQLLWNYYHDIHTSCASQEDCATNKVDFF
ncbi:MAG: tRNA dihydrouridine synthase DusB [Candidatus Magnetomorum sp.]|nr:tRNA dihydrouridine synthase DusB [Candidatus Magnetomorum sp.]